MATEFVTGNSLFKKLNFEEIAGAVGLCLAVVASAASFAWFSSAKARIGQMLTLSCNSFVDSSSTTSSMACSMRAIPWIVGGNRGQHGVSQLRLRRRLLAATAEVAVPGSAVDAFTKYSGYLFENGVLSEAELLDEYDISAISAICRRKSLLVLRRFFQIGTTFGRWFALRYIDGLLERSDEMFQIRASELRMLLVELGPAFVKIAQAVSSRPDVIPPAYLNELSLLQDRITPFQQNLLSA
ncbi:hypothetical protein HPP92_012655 [Vanilla planifolia]|uniref:Uncharacterized protein n=1 Tax=Vanilla planifolia TaxID=51239 RepID=A0A835QQW3_VANPL|nr:hypothetical protein HPP92_012655 [Vanilla planifolia]